MDIDSELNDPPGQAKSGSARPGSCCTCDRRAVFGYRNRDVFDGTNAHRRPRRSHVRRDIHEAEAAVVRRIFESCATVKNVHPAWLGWRYALDTLLHECMHVSVAYRLGGSTGPTSHNCDAWWLFRRPRRGAPHRMAGGRFVCSAGLPRPGVARSPAEPLDDLGTRRLIDLKKHQRCSPCCTHFNLPCP